MIKLLHTADIHLDSPLRSLALRGEHLREQVQVASRQAFTQLINYALAESVSALLISGDLFDGAVRSAKTAAYLVRELERLRSQGIQVYYIKGNHDAENPISGEVALPDNVHTFDGRGSKVQLLEGVWVHGVSFSAKQAPDSLLHKFPSPVPDAINIALLHTSLTGAGGHDPYAPCTVSELSAMGFDYWALGHVHKRQVHSQDPWIVMPGIPQGRDIGESGPKSATLLCVDEGSISTQEVPTSVIEFLAHTIDISGNESDEDLRAVIRHEMSLLVNELRSEYAIIRLTLSGIPARSWQLLRDAELWQDNIEELALETGRLSVEKLQFDFDRTAPAAMDKSAVQELLILMQSIAQEESFKSNMLSQVQLAVNQIPAQERGRLVPDEAAMLSMGELACAEGAEYLHALMRGASQ